MTTEEKFFAAVNVIRGLPKNGSFKPSVDMKLKFYGYFKQATEGPNNTSKPYMWEIVSKAKWDAWHRLGKMSKEDAMMGYLRELNSIVESMAESANVEEFLIGMDDFYAQVPAKDVDLCIGPTIEKIRAKSTKPLPPHPAAFKQSSKSLTMSEEDDDEFYLDSMDTVVVSDNNTTPSEGNKMVSINGHLGNKEFHQESTADILSKSVIKIRTELNEISNTIQKIEQQQKLISRGRSKLFGNLSSSTITFITLWPILVNVGLIWLYSRRRKSQ